MVIPVGTLCASRPVVTNITVALVVVIRTMAAELWWLSIGDQFITVTCVVEACKQIGFARLRADRSYASFIGSGEVISIQALYAIARVVILTAAAPTNRTGRHTAGGDTRVGWLTGVTVPKVVQIAFFAVHGALGRTLLAPIRVDIVDVPLRTQRAGRLGCT